MSVRKQSWENRALWGWFQLDGDFAILCCEVTGMHTSVQGISCAFAPQSACSSTERSEVQSTTYCCDCAHVGCGDCWPGPKAAAQGQVGHADPGFLASEDSFVEGIVYWKTRSLLRFCEIKTRKNGVCRSSSGDSECMNLVLGTIADSKPEHSLLFAVQMLTQGRDRSSTEKHESRRSHVWGTKVQGKFRCSLQPGMHEHLMGADI